MSNPSIELGTYEITVELETATQKETFVIKLNV